MKHFCLICDNVLSLKQVIRLKDNAINETLCFWCSKKLIRKLIEVEQ